MKNSELRHLLSGEYDSCNAIMTLHAGTGGTEACDWVSMLYRMYTRWFQTKGFSVQVLDYLDGDITGIKNVTFEVSWRQCLWLSEIRKRCTSACKNFAI